VKQIIKFKFKQRYFFCEFFLFILTLLFIFYNRQKNRNIQLLSQKSVEIQLKNDRLQKSNDVLQQFAYASAHDLKEPLRSISGFVSIIRRVIENSVVNNRRDFTYVFAAKHITCIDANTEIFYF